MKMVLRCSNEVGLKQVQVKQRAFPRCAPQRPLRPYARREEDGQFCDALALCVATPAQLNAYYDAVCTIVETELCSKFDLMVSWDVPDSAYVGRGRFRLV